MLEKDNVVEMDTSKVAPTPVPSDAVASVKPTVPGNRPFVSGLEPEYQEARAKELAKPVPPPTPEKGNFVHYMLLKIHDMLAKASGHHADPSVEDSYVPVAAEPSLNPTVTVTGENKDASKVG